jgi:hypothetical protein
MGKGLEKLLHMVGSRCSRNRHGWSIIYYEVLDDFTIWINWFFRDIFEDIRERRSIKHVISGICVNPNPDSYKKKCKAVQPGVIFDSQVPNRKMEELPVRGPLPLPHSLVIALESYVYDSQPAGLHKISTKNKWKFLLFDWKIA